MKPGLLRHYLEVELKILAGDPIFFCTGFIDGDCARVPHFNWCKNMEYSWRYKSNNLKKGEKWGCYDIIWK